MPDYTSVELDGPRIEHKRAITLAGIRRQEWLPASGAVHLEADAPQFIYEHDQNYREEEKNGTVDIYIPVKFTKNSR